MIDTRWKKLRTRRSLNMSPGSSQKSAAKRCASGRPTTTEPRNAPARHTAPSAGWKKYRKVLPVANDNTERPMSVTALRITMPGTRRPLATRRAMATKDQASAAAMAAPVPATWSNRRNNAAGTMAPSIACGTALHARSGREGTVNPVAVTCCSWISNATPRVAHVTPPRSRAVQQARTTVRTRWRHRSGSDGGHVRD